MLRILKRSKLALVLLLIAIITIITSSLVVNKVAERHRAQVERELRNFLGADITFDTLKVRLWGGPGFSAYQFRIADDPRFAATPFLRARELKLGLDLWHLLRGDVLITSLRFEDAEFQIITNEAGLVNTSQVAARKKHLTAAPKIKVPAPEKPVATHIFEIRSVRVRNGRLDFIDRSANPPAELQVKNIEMDARGLTPSAPTSIAFTAALTQGLTYDVKIDGTVGPLQENRDWSQQPVNLDMQFDALYLPAVARALPAMRNKLPAELNVTGPMSLEANLAGTLQRPRLTDVDLKVPLFGAADYNATLTGAAVFPEHGEWTDAALKGSLTLDRVNLSQLRTVPSLRDLLPANVITQGTMSADSRFEGTWKTLRVGLSAEADATDFVLDDWLRKPPGYKARVRAQFARVQERLLLLPSSLIMGSSTFEIGGSVDDSEDHSAIQINLKSGRASVASLATLISPLASYDAKGVIDCDLVLQKIVSAESDSWKARGTLNLADFEIASRDSDKKITHLYGNVVFGGTEARFDNGSFQLGSSRFKVAARIPVLAKTRATYSLTAPELDLADVPSLPVPAGIKLKQVSSRGDIKIENGAAVLNGTVISAGGGLRTITYQNLKTDIAWSPSGLKLRNLALEAFGGSINSDLTWATDDNGNRLELKPEFKSVDVKRLFAEAFPQLKNPITGILDFHGSFTLSSKPGGTVREEIQGRGEAAIRNGTVTGFNLIRQFILRGHRPSGTSRLPPTLIEIADRPDTPLESLKVDFNLNGQGRLTGNVVMSTEDYIVTGSGWVNSSRTTKWNGDLSLAPAVTQDLLREYRTIRFFVDRRGRLPIAFKIDGKLPNLTIQPENRVLAQAFRWGSRVSLSDKPETQKKEPKKWVPDSLDRLLGR